VQEIRRRGGPTEQDDGWDPVVVKEIYAIMDREFEKDIKKWRMKLG
jgi:hypothetical protein